MPQIKRGSSYFQRGTSKLKSGTVVSYGQLLSKEMTSIGYPDAIKIVSEIEEPAFKGLPDGAAVGIIKFHPMSENEKIQTASEAGVPEHMSYGYVLKGEPVARISHYNSVKKLYPDLYPMELDQLQYPLSDIGTKESHHGEVNWMPSDLTARDINDIAKEDRLNKSNTKHEEIKNAMLNYMPSEVNLQPQQMPNGTLYMAAGGYKIIQQTGGNFRLYSPTGTLVAVNQTLEDSKKKLEKILK
jgi:hypothetical protein